MKALFCNKCHKRIIPPAFLTKGNVKISGNIILKCGDKTCTGQVKIKPAKVEIPEIVEQVV